MSKPTTVISVRGRDRDVLLADPDFLYVGRPIYRGANWKGSVWANPFKVGMKRPAAISMLGRDVDWEIRADTVNSQLCVRFYYFWLKDQPKLLARLPELVGRTLGCWCGEWKPGELSISCHAVVLAQMANKLNVEAPTP